MGIYEDKRSIPVRYVEIDQNGYPRSPQKIPAFRIIKFGLVTLIQFFFFCFSTRDRYFRERLCDFLGRM